MEYNLVKIYMYYFGCDQFYFPPAAALPGGSVEAEIFSSNFKMWLLWHILWGSLGIFSIWGNIGMPCNNDFFSDKRCLDETLGHLHQQAAGQIKNQMGDHSEHCTDVTHIQEGSRDRAIIDSYMAYYSKTEHPEEGIYKCVEND